MSVTGLDRELVWWVSRPWSRAHAARTFGLGAGWAAIYVGLCLWRGVAWYDPWQAVRNLEFPGLLPDNYDPYYRAYAWFGVLFIGPAVWSAWRTWARQPRLTRSAMLVVIPAFVVTAFFFSSSIETRIVAPLIHMLAATVTFGIPGADIQSTGA